MSESGQRCVYGPTYLQVANPDVKAEKSTNWTIGMILEPVPKWLTTFDYYSIELKDQIIPAAQTPNYDPIANAVRGPIQNVTFADGSQGLSPAGVIAYINVPLVNAGRRRRRASTWRAAIRSTCPTRAS